MTDITAIAERQDDNIVFAIEAGMERLRDEFAQAQNPGASCQICRSRLRRDYVRLRQSDAESRLRRSRAAA